MSATLPGQLVVMSECPECTGTGWLKNNYCASSAATGNTSKNVYGSILAPAGYTGGALPPPIVCPWCIRGFLFQPVHETVLLSYLLDKLGDLVTLGTNEGAKLRQAIHVALMMETESRMVVKEPLR